MGVAEWKHLGSDFGLEPGRICANLTRPPAAGQSSGEGKEGAGGWRWETGGWIEPGINIETASDTFRQLVLIMFLHAQRGQFLQIRIYIVLNQKTAPGSVQKSTGGLLEFAFFCYGCIKIITGSF